MRERVFVPKHSTAEGDTRVRRPSHIFVMSAGWRMMRKESYLSLLEAFLEGEASALGVSGLLSEAGDEVAPFTPGALEPGDFLA